jgi:hypothetical protein
MEQKNVALLVGAFVALLIGVVLIGTIASSTNAVTKKTIASAETANLYSNGCWHLSSGVEQVNGTTDADCNITVTNAPTGWRTESAEGCGIGSVVVTNSSGNTFTLNTDYLVFPYSGIIQMLNTSRTSSGASGLGALNTTIVYYNYCRTDYVNSGFGRSATDLIAGFFALSLLVISVGLFYQVLKNEGLTNI